MTQTTYPTRVFGLDVDPTQLKSGRFQHKDGTISFEHFTTGWMATLAVPCAGCETITLGPKVFQVTSVLTFDEARAEVRRSTCQRCRQVQNGDIGTLRALLVKQSRLRLHVVILYCSAVPRAL
jgi:hypothetical protein